MKYAVGLDFGGTLIKGGIVSREGDILSSAAIPLPNAPSPRRAVNATVAMVESLLSAGHISRENLSCCGVGAPGPMNRERTLIRCVPNIPGWRNVPLKRMIEKTLRLPTVVENDANLAAVGEQWKGAARNVETFVLFTLGTGIGGGVILDNRLWTGHDGAAGEFGHIIVEPDGRRCGCGRRGCVEQYASATALCRTFREMGGRPIHASAKEICDAAKRGNRRALAALRSLSKYLAIAIAACVHILHPKLIVLSGGLSSAGTLLISMVRKETASRIMPIYAKSFSITRGKLGNRAGVLGAAYWAFHRERVKE